MNQTARSQTEQSVGGCSRIWAGTASSGMSAARPAGLLLIGGDLLAFVVALAAVGLIVPAILPSATSPDAGQHISGLHIALTWVLPAVTVWLATSGRARRRSPAPTPPPRGGPARPLPPAT